MQSIATAKSLVAKHKYELDSSTELIAWRVAKFAGTIIQAYPVTGYFSHSAGNDVSGDQSGVSGMISALLIGMVLHFLADKLRRRKRSFKFLG